MINVLHQNRDVEAFGHGQERNRQSLRDHFGVKPKNLGAPSFAYQVETAAESYTVDRAGIVTSSGGNEVDFEDILCRDKEDVLGSGIVLD